MAQITSNSSTNDTTKKDREDGEKSSTIIAYAVFGCLVYVMLSVIFSGTQDILAGTDSPTTMVLFAAIVPMFLVDTIAPYFIDRLSNLILVCINFLNASAGFIVVAYAKQVEWKIAGVGLATCGIAVGVVNMMSLTSYFQPIAVSAYSSGTGVGLLTGALYYTAMTTWLCVSPDTTMVVLAPLSILFLVSYYVISKNKPDKIATIKYSTNKTIDSFTHREVVYTKIEDGDTDDGEDEETNDRRPEKSSTKKSVNTREYEYLTRKEKMLVIAKLFSLTVVPAFTLFFSQYLFTQSVMTTIAYKNAPFSPRDHYQYYIFIFTFGELVGRCHRTLLSLVNPHWLGVPTPELLWVQSGFSTLSMFVLVTESWCRFLPSVAIVLLLCFLVGILAGSSYNNILVLLHERFEGKQCSFVMVYAFLPLNVGMLAASIVGLYVEPRLLEHCISTVTDSAYCFTRSASVNVTSGC